jgi:hypothetical protein
LQHLVGAGADAEVIREIDPADCAGGVDEELRRARYVMTVDAGSFVEEVVAADYFGIGVGEECIRVAGLAVEVLRLSGSVNTDGDRLDA